MSAYNSMNASAISDLSPMLGASAAETFRNVRSYHETLENCTPVDLKSPDLATITCVRQVEYVPNVGSRTTQKQSVRTLFTLRRSGGTWRIESTSRAQ